MAIALSALVLAHVHTAATVGIEAFHVDVEVDQAGGLPAYRMVGLPAAAVQQGLHRVRAALANSGFPVRASRVTVNLAPADIRKDGGAFDLPIAVGLLATGEHIAPEALVGRLFIGELALDGRLRPARGVLPIARYAGRAGYREIILPVENASEAVYCKQLAVRPAASLKEVIAFLQGDIDLAPPATTKRALRNRLGSPLDYSDVRGQPLAVRALEIAASGGHNILLVGPPGAGKTMLAQRLPTVLPTLTEDEALETTTVYSVAGLLAAVGAYESGGLMAERPFRAPHHTVSTAGLVGGGDRVRPGEVSLAHNGVLFLDELLEYPRHVLETLRQPLEDKRITIVRARQAVTYPASFTLVGAMNPCPCGHLGNSARNCTCGWERVLRYRGRLSGPLLDRFDMHIWVGATSYRDLAIASPGTSSNEIAARVAMTRRRQRPRFARLGLHVNAQMSGAHLRKFCRLDRSCQLLLEQHGEVTGLSTRAIERLVRVARTIADRDGHENGEIREDHLLEAIGYRYLDTNPIEEPRPKPALAAAGGARKFDLSSAGQTDSKPTGQERTCHEQVE